MRIGKARLGVLVTVALTWAGCGGGSNDTSKVDCGCPDVGTNDCLDASTMETAPPADVSIDLPTEAASPEANPCHPCEIDADCTGGLVCFDEDNNPATPKVCTKPYDPNTGCPDGMHGDYNVSKYCICDDCGGEYNPKCEPTSCLITTDGGSKLGECKLTGDKCYCQPASNPCQKCESDADCTGGLVCFDEDNNAGTPKVCTKPYDPNTGCPAGMHGDYNVSKYCICEDCGSIINPRCEPLVCLAQGTNGAFVGECKLTGDKCDCQPSANPCQKCEKDADCTGGLQCLDDDNNPATPKVCTKVYVPADGCPAGMHGDYAISKFCICEDCGSVFNPKCEATECLGVNADGVTKVGSCKLANGKCDCAVN